MREEFEARTVGPAREGRRLPGVEGVWVFVLADMTIFGLLFASFMVDRHQNLAIFEESRRALNLDFGGVNTLVLLTSSMFVVLALEALKLGRPRLPQTFFALALTCGLAFMVNKFFEYKEKLDAGISMLTNDFFMYYFVLTGMHLVHVTAGCVVLAVLRFKSRSEPANGGSLTGYESGATYWHMVDLVWICLFPLLYLVR